MCVRAVLAEREIVDDPVPVLLGSGGCVVLRDRVVSATVRTHRSSLSAIVSDLRDAVDVFAMVPGGSRPERELVAPDVNPAMGMRDRTVPFDCAC